jgi:antitoxin component of RelBE/YafQ-DinJ toxin-antitoxin module
VLGLSISSAINLYIKKVLSVKRIPFTIGLDDNSIETIEFVKAMENIPQGLEKIAKKAGINNEKELLDYFYE